MRSPFGILPLALCVSWLGGCSAGETATHASALLAAAEARLETLATAAPRAEAPRPTDRVLATPVTSSTQRNRPSPRLASVVRAEAETPVDVPRAPTPQPALPEPPNHVAVEPTPRPDGPELVATSKETIIYARPSLTAPKLGYLRAGAVVARDAHPAAFEGCRGGFTGSRRRASYGGQEMQSGSGIPTDDDRRCSVRRRQR